MMGYPPRDEAWEKVRTLENLLAMVASIEDRIKVIRAQSWFEGDWHSVFVEATATKRECEDLRALMSERWEVLYVRAAGKDRVDIGSVFVGDVDGV